MNILVIGESCRDIFSYGECRRLCPEAPVPVFNLIKTIENGGMAMNVKNNLESLGANINLHTNKNWRQITKNRFIDLKTNHMFMRLDCGDSSFGRSTVSKINFKKYDGVVISDYNKGFLSEKEIDYICTQHKNTFLDTKKILGNWCSNARFIKINIHEWEKTKHTITQEVENKIIVTMGPNGCLHNGIIYPVKEVEIKDVSGAGDTFIAALSYKYLETNDIQESIKFGNECSTKVVQKRGVSTL